MISKTCNACNVPKPLDQFYKDKSQPDGHRCRCKACEKAKQAAYRAEHRNRFNARRTAAYNADAELREQAAACKRSPKGKFTNYKSSAKKRNLTFDLTMDEFMSFWQGNCNYCGDQIATVGIDRVDSDIGYTLDNCVPCCKRCNEIKMAHSVEETNMHMLKMLKHQGVV